jgi:hypothetical protein
VRLEDGGAPFKEPFVKVPRVEAFRELEPVVEPINKRIYNGISQCMMTLPFYTFSCERIYVTSLSLARSLLPPVASVECEAHFLKCFTIPLPLHTVVRDNRTARLWKGVIMSFRGVNGCLVLLCCVEVMIGVRF